MAGLLDIRVCRGCSGQPGSEDDRHRAKTTLSLAMLDRSRRRERDMKTGTTRVGGFPFFYLPANPTGILLLLGM